MHFVKFVDKESFDPRCRNYYLYVCANPTCNHEEIFWWVSNFDTERYRKCPKCGITIDTDNREILAKKKIELESKIKTWSEELSRINLELSKTFSEEKLEKIR